MSINKTKMEIVTEVVCRLCKLGCAGHTSSYEKGESGRIEPESWMAASAQPDVIACKDGRFIVLEIVCEGCELTAKQANRMKVYAKAGAITGCVSSAAEVEKLIMNQNEKNETQEYVQGPAFARRERVYRENENENENVDVTAKARVPCDLSAEVMFEGRWFKAMVVEKAVASGWRDTLVFVEIEIE